MVALARSLSLNGSVVKNGTEWKFCTEETKERTKAPARARGTTVGGCGFIQAGFTVESRNCVSEIPETSKHYCTLKTQISSVRSDSLHQIETVGYDPPWLSYKMQGDHEH